MTDLAHRMDGPTDGPVLVLGNSLGTTGEVWGAQVGPLAATHRVLRYDHRGHGGSPVPRGPYTIDDLGGDLLALLDRLAVERADLAGLSLGGMVAMWVAAHAPERVRRVALVCTSARPAQPEFWRQRAARARTDGLPAMADAIVGRWFTPAFARANPGVLRWATDMVAATSNEGYAACCEAIAVLDLVPLLPRITAPTLVVAGAADPAFPLPHAEAMTAGIPGARLQVVDAAHLANVEQPDVVNRLLVDFFTGGTG